MTGPEGLPPGYPWQPDLEITPRDVKQALDAKDPSLVLIDCRTSEEWSAAHVKDATLIPLNELPSRVREIEDLAGEDATVAVICHRGSRSLRATIFLRQQGVNARSVAGGIDLWSLTIDPAVPRY